MSYQISRAGQIYGPYTLEDLQRYVASGNILLTDLAKSDTMTDWVPVAHILNPATAPIAPAGVAAPPYAAPGAPYGQQPPGYAVSPYPDPPNLHWAIVLLLAIFTCGVFSIIWDFVQVLWMKRIEPQLKAFPYFLAYAILSFINGVFSAGSMHNGHYHGSALGGLAGIAAFVFLILYRFAMRDSLERHFNSTEPIGLRLGPVMTFFFGGIYFQYHFNQINAAKQSLRYRSGL